MKRLILSMLLLGSISLLSYKAEAQVSINVNIGSQPQWGPVGYQHVDYYYLPDIESYYYVPTRQFIYLDAGRWIFSASLPSRYRGYDLYGGYKVVINRPYAYRYFDRDRNQYGRYRGWDGERQVIIRDHRGYGNPHGLPPGQAKKIYRYNDDDRYYSRGRDYDRRDRDNDRWDRGNHGNGRGHGKHGHDRDDD